MSRRLGIDENELKIQDNLSGTDIVLKYRQPTSAEMAEYSNKQIERKRNKITVRQGEMRLEYGAKILTGFRDGDFEIPDGAGGWRKIASDQGSPNFDTDWLNHIKKYGSDLIMLLAAQVFDQSATVIDGDEDLEKN